MFSPRVVEIDQPLATSIPTIAHTGHVTKAWVDVKAPSPTGGILEGYKLMCVCEGARALMRCACGTSRTSSVYRCAGVPLPCPHQRDRDPVGRTGSHAVTVS
jgi:hypothetical protein